MELIKQRIKSFLGFVQPREEIVNYLLGLELGLHYCQNLSYFFHIQVVFGLS